MSCCGQATLAVPVAGGDDVPVEEERVRQASLAIDEATLRTTFHVPGVHCIGCVRNIEREISKFPYVANVRGNLSNRQVAIDWRPAEGPGVKFETWLGAAGYEPALVQAGVLAADGHDETYRKLLTCLGVAGFAAANVMLLSVSVWSGAEAETRQLFHLISGLIAIPAALYAGQPFFGSAFQALRQWRLNMDVPISLAVVLALVMSIIESLGGGEEAYFDAAVMLLFFLLIGRTLDHMMRERARHSVKLLAGLAAKGAIRISADGGQHYVDASAVVPGDRLLVAAGERVPVDGIVERGMSDLDRALVTGEAASVACGSGDAVEAGTMNLTGPLEVRATKPASQSFIAEVVAMMAAAEEGKAGFARIADRAARIYAPAVHILAFVTFLAWLAVSGGDWKVAGYTAIAVLIVTCPCALGLAVPIVHVVGAGRLFERGIMMRDGGSIEKLNEVDTALFDKTGTLTLGQPKVVARHVSPRQSALAAELARGSRHPASEAILRDHPGAPAVGVNDLTEVAEVPGAGVEGWLDGKRVRLGRLEWVREIARTLPVDTSAPSSAGTSARTAVWIGVEGEAPASFELEDGMRPDARASIRALRDRGIDVAILSGDVMAVVERLGHALDIEARFGEMRPADKIDAIAERKAVGHRVLMVGDGLNDAPALASADVSMVPASASDVGRQAADFVFTGRSLGAVPFTIDIARRADQLVRQNIALAVLYNCFAVPLAAFGFVTPLIAAIAMSGSSILVVGNSLRLRSFNAGIDERQPVAGRAEGGDGATRSLAAMAQEA